MKKEHKTDGTPCWCNPKIVKVLSKEQEVLVEKLAEIEHQRWSDWQKYVFDKCKTQDSGRGVGKPFDLIIPSELVEHWQRQINTPYSELSEKEKDSDREQVKRYWNLISKEECEPKRVNGKIDMGIKDKKIGFIGNGYIGGNLADNLKERGFKNLVRYSLEKEYVGNKEKIKDCDIVFVAVPTPTTSEGFDSRIVEEAVGLCRDNSIVVIKSTVPCTVLEDLSEKFKTKIIIHNPEFLDVNTAKEDTDSPKKNIFGISSVATATELAHLISCVNELKEILPKALYNNTMGYRESSLVKYFHNTFFYTKNVLFNMFYDLAIKNDCSWDVVLEAVLSEPRINPIHTCPVDKGGRGAGGECLIKDFVIFKYLYLAYFGDDEDGNKLLEMLEKKNLKNLRDSEKDLELLKGVYGK